MESQQLNATTFYILILYLKCFLRYPKIEFKQLQVFKPCLQLFYTPTRYFNIVFKTLIIQKYN